jgi:subtilisin family serine protease
MHKRGVARFVRILSAAAVAASFGVSTSTHIAASPSWQSKLDPLLRERVLRPGRSPVVLRGTAPGAATSSVPAFNVLGVRTVRALPLIDGLALDVPNAALPALAAHPLVERLSLDRPVFGANERTGATTGAASVRQELGFDGAGVGVAIIDSGVAPSHDDLTDASGAPRVARFVDLVNGRPASYDDYGHGTHVAGIVSGNGFDSSGARTGIAPGASLTVLKVLDGNGRGRISDVIAALDYVVLHKDELHIRIVNLSVATGVYESYDTDPLTLAARRAVSAGIVVVAAAGNNGRGQLGTAQYSGITAPGNAPWVLTVGASSHMGTAGRDDDRIAAFSSRGPGAIDYSAKPDLVAPGVGIESLSDPASRLYVTAAPYLLAGTIATSYLPYLSQSGTSMSAPVAAGTVALMLQANPALTPNLVKAILQYTAQPHPGYDSLTQGAGFLNAKGAVELAAYLAAGSSAAYPSATGWSRRLIWGNHLASGGRLSSGANAWSLNITWGDPVTADGQPVAWGLADNGPWQTAGGRIRNVVWGSMCGGDDCLIPWIARTVSSATEGEGDTVVWGTTEGEGDTVVWGTTEGEGDTVVWGTSCTDLSCVPVVWNPQ